MVAPPSGASVQELVLCKHYVNRYCSTLPSCTHIAVRLHKNVHLKSSSAGQREGAICTGKFQPVCMGKAARTHSRYRPAAGFEVHASYRPLKSFCSTPLHTSCLQDIWSLKLPLPNEELTKWRAQDARPKSGEPPRYSLQRAVARSGSCGSAALTEQACPPEIALPHRCCPSTASPIHRCSHSAVLFDSLVLIS